MADNRRVDFRDIRRRADFRAVLAHYGLPPVGKGDQVKIRCPFHPDEEPSCSVNLAKRLFHCFACRAAGDALEFVHRMEARDGSPVTLRQAGVTLAGICGERPAGGEAQAHQGRLEGHREAAKGGTAHKPHLRALLRVLGLLLAVERAIRGRRRRPSATSRSGSRSRSTPRTRT
jgi:hypothetical protein